MPGPKPAVPLDRAPFALFWITNPIPCGFVVVEFTDEVPEGAVYVKEICSGWVTETGVLYEATLGVLLFAEGAKVNTLLEMVVLELLLPEVVQPVPEFPKPMMVWLPVLFGLRTLLVLSDPGAVILTGPELTAAATTRLPVVCVKAIAVGAMADSAPSCATFTYTGTSRLVRIPIGVTPDGVLG